MSADMTGSQDPDATIVPVPRGRSSAGQSDGSGTTSDVSSDASSDATPDASSGEPTVIETVTDVAAVLGSFEAAAEASPPPAEPVSAWRLDGFEELHELGRGGFGRVVAARHVASGTLVAIKYLSAELTGESQFRESFRAEAATLQGLSSPYITRFFEYVEEQAGEQPGEQPAGGGAAIVMELVPGVSLRALLKGHETLPPEAALVVLKGSLLGLAVAHHAGIVHRDYKPENVLVLREGWSKLSDFGIAVRAGDLTAPSVGTAAYLAPELWRGEAPTARCDIYAATVTFFECVAGRRPYAGSDPGVLGPAHLHAPIPAEAVPPQVRSLVQRGLAKEPAQRPDHAVAFLAELEAVATQAYGTQWEERGRQRLAVLAAAGLAALGLAAIPALSVLFGSAGGGGAAVAGGIGAAGAGAGAGAAAGATASGVAAAGAGASAGAAAGATAGGVAAASAGATAGAAAGGAGAGAGATSAAATASAGAAAASSAATTATGTVQAAQGAVRGARAGRQLLRARHLVKPATTAGKVAAAVTAAAVVAAGVVVGVHQVDKPKPRPTASSGAGAGGGGGAAGTAWHVDYRASNQSYPVPGGDPKYPDLISTQTPVITGMADPALQKRVNSLLAKPIEDAVAANRKALSSSSPSDNANLGYAFTDTVTATTAGRLLYVRYSLSIENGTGDGSWITPQTLLLRTDTWQQVPQSRLLAATAEDASNQSAVMLAGRISASLVFDGGPHCFATTNDVLYQNADGSPTMPDDGGHAYDSAHPAKRELGQAVIGVTPTGYEFRYSAGLLSHACESSAGVVPFAALDGIADPSIIALAQAQGPVKLTTPVPQLVETYSADTFSPGALYVDPEALRAGLAGSGGFRASGSVCALVPAENVSQSTSSVTPACYQLTMAVDADDDIHARWTDPAGTEVEEYVVGGVWYLSSNDPQAAFPGLSAGELSRVSAGRLFSPTPAELDEIVNQVENGTFTDDFSLLTVAELLGLIDPGGAANVDTSGTQGADTVLDCTSDDQASVHETLTVRTSNDRLQSVSTPQQGARLQFSGYGAVPRIDAPNGVS